MANIKTYFITTCELQKIDLLLKYNENTIKNVFTDNS